MGYLRKPTTGFALYLRDGGPHDGGFVHGIAHSTSGNFFTKDPAAGCRCQQWGLRRLRTRSRRGAARPLVRMTGCTGGWDAPPKSGWTISNWLTSNNYLRGVATTAEGICLADGYYTISYDPAL